jgi:tight adherence protein B
VTLFVLVILLVGSAAGVWFVLRTTRAGNQVAVSSRLGRYGVAGLTGSGQNVSHIISPYAKQRSEQSNLSRAVDRVVEKRKFGKRIAVRLERADLRWTPGEYVVLCLAIVFVGSLVGLIVYGTAGLLIGGTLGLVGPWFYLSKRISKRRSRFQGQLADMAQMMGNSMRAGFSIMQSMELVATEGPSPAAEEFERVTAEVKLGLPLDQALQHLETRIPSEDLELMVIAINVQRQVGGNLAEILMVISKTVRERVRFQRDLRTLTAQARYSSYVITGLPVAVGIVINLIDRSYESYLYTATLGHVMIGAALVMLGLGFFFLSRIAKIEV